MVSRFVVPLTMVTMVIVLVMPDRGHSNTYLLLEGPNYPTQPHEMLPNPDLYTPMEENAQYSYSMWIRVGSFPLSNNGRECIFERVDVGSNKPAPAMYLLSSGHVQVDLTLQDNSMFTCTSTSILPLNQWTHLHMITLDAYKCQFFFDGRHASRVKTTSPAQYFMRFTDTKFMFCHGSAAGVEIADLQFDTEAETYSQRLLQKMLYRHPREAGGVIVPNRSKANTDLTCLPDPHKAIHNMHDATEYCFDLIITLNSGDYASASNDLFNVFGRFPDDGSPEIKAMPSIYMDTTCRLIIVVSFTDGSGVLHHTFHYTTYVLNPSSSDSAGRHFKLCVSHIHRRADLYCEGSLNSEQNVATWTNTDTPVEAASAAQKLDVVLGKTQSLDGMDIAGFPGSIRQLSFWNGYIEPCSDCL